MGTSSAAVAPPPTADAGTTNTTDTTTSYTNASFQQTPGGGLAYVVGAGDDSPWVIGTDHYVYHYNNDCPPPRTWNKDWASANTASLAVSPEGTPWRVDTSGNVTKLAGVSTTCASFTGSWTAVGSGFLASEIGVGAGNVAWAIGKNSCNSKTTNCPIYQLVGNSWSSTANYGRHIAVSPAGTAYMSSNTGTLYKWTGSSFTAWPGGVCVHNATPGTPVIGAGPNDAVWVIDCTAVGSDYYIYAWHPQNSYWEQIPNAGGVSISVSADGTPWLINAATNIWEYVSTWQPMGSWGFSFVDRNGVGETWTGEVHDVDAVPSSGAITIAATSGGVWQTPPTFGWVPIGDVGAGVGSAGTLPTGPSNSAGTVTVKPSDQNTVLVGTGVAGSLNGPNGNGNGIWITHNAGSTPVTWTQAAIYDQNQNVVNPGDPNYPTTIVKVRYSADGTNIYALSTLSLYVSADDGATFHQASDSACTPAPTHVFTDLVVDPNHSDITYLGVAGEGVYQATVQTPAPVGTITCSPGAAPPLYSGQPATITSVALAISANSLLYAAFAGLPNGFGDAGNDFENIDSTTTGTWGQAWTLVLRPDSPLLPCNSPCISQWGLGSQNNTGGYGQAHDWAIGTDPSGTILLLGGVGLYRGTSCGQNGCTSFVQISPEGGPSETVHADYHAVSWGSNGWVYVANDGGLFYSTDSGATWRNQTNSFGVSNETSVDVHLSNIFGAAWDVGGYYSTDMGTTWSGFESNAVGLDSHRNSLVGDARLAIADQGGATNGFISTDGIREAWDGTTWTDIDFSGPVEQGNSMMAKGVSGPLFTTGATASETFVYYNNTPNSAYGWIQYQGPLPAQPWAVYASNENPPSVYAVTGTNQLNVSITGGPWLSPLTPGWPWGYQFGGVGSAPGAAFATDRLNYDLYAVGVNSSQNGAAVIKSPAASHGQRWTSLTGTVSVSQGVPGMLKQDEIVKTIFPDSSSGTVIVGSDGTAPASSVYGAGTIWRLNNPNVSSDMYHHWRPWVRGLPFGTLPANWITGQYENGTYYYYIATWGRGVWKREARGGDF